MEKEMKNKQKKSKMPEGYIGRPKPMKTKTFEFHKPTTSFYVKLGIAAVIIAFIVYIVLRLISVSSYHQPDFEFFEYNSAFLKFPPSNTSVWNPPANSLSRIA